MLATTLQLAQRMLEIGESEEEVASALLSFLSSRYPWETKAAVMEMDATRLVCHNGGPMVIHHTKEPVA
jgi:hypothetical protein